MTVPFSGHHDKGISSLVEALKHLVLKKKKNQEFMIQGYFEILMLWAKPHFYGT